MKFSRVMLPVALVILCGAAKAQPIDDTLPPTYVPSGEQMFKQYCAVCHGSDAKGDGPMAPLLRTPPPNLTTLAQRHMGKFPYEYVKSVLEFGRAPLSHGTSEMPTWGPLFRHNDKQNERVVQQRIKNLCDFLASIQER